MDEAAVIVTSPLSVKARVYDSSTSPVTGLSTLAGSVAFCCSLIDLTSVFLLGSGSKSENLGWNIHGTKFLWKRVSYVRSTALETILWEAEV